MPKRLPKTVLSAGILGIFGLGLLPTISSCSKPPSALERVQQRGEILIVTRNSPTTYYEGPDGPTGFEYDLISQFADHLGVEIRLIVPKNFDEILPLVYRGQVHLAAAGLTVTPERSKKILFGPAYQYITQQVVYRAGHARPRSVKDLVGGRLAVIAGTSHSERLHELKKTVPNLEWREIKDMESEELLEQVWDGELDYTVADSNEVAVNRRYYPELRVAFNLTKPQSLAWAFPKSGDDSLYNAARAFFEKLTTSGRLDQLVERYYGHVNDFDYVGTVRFLSHYKQRLPRFQDMFEEAANETGIDWRLLAAIGYQESHWNPRARSPTGVRGIMMVTRSTAAQFGFTNRIAPRNSILGGSRYFAHVLKRVPETIAEPDRTWMALAAYNLGYGHISDCRKIIEQRDSNPNQWVEIKQCLPLLRQKKWYKNTRHGYARGSEAVTYVENIRSYYDLLVRLTEPEPKVTESLPTFEQLTNDAPTINSPVL